VFLLLHLLGSPIGTQRRLAELLNSGAIGGWRTCREHPERIDPTRMTRSGGKPGRNLAAQQAPDLTLANPLCCGPGWGAAMPFDQLKRRQFIALLSGAAAWPLAAHAQQPTMPIVAFVNAGSSDAPLAAAFRKGLNDAGYVESQNVTVEYHWLEGQFDRLPALMADLVHRRVSVIATPAGNFAAQAAKAATTTVPIVFGVAEDPVKLGLVASLARPGGNATGINFFNNETDAKRLGLLHDLVPKAVRIAVLVNPANFPVADSTLQDLPEAARAVGLQIQVLKASTRSEIEAAFATLVRNRAEALYVAGDTFFTSRRVQFATLAASYRIPASYPTREAVEVGGLMSYGTDRVDMSRQIGVYTGQILKGAKPADLPVLQSTKFEFVINLQTARALGIEVPNSIQLLADEIIE
jgi:putative tryptophan/tyrosine transport system substrate-binding protein